MIRPRGARARGDNAGGQGTTVDRPSVVVGAELRAARLEKGLGLVAVHDKLGRSITQIEHLEAGSAAAFDDAGLARSTVRRYATLLGLDGDDLAARFGDGLPDDLMNGPITTAVPISTGAPAHLRAFTETGEVPAVAGRAVSTDGPSTGLVSSGPPTGTFPVVPRTELRHNRRAMAKARRRMRAPTLLKVVTWLMGGLLLAVVAGFVLLAAIPQRLADAHILRVVEPGGAGGSGTQPVPPTPVAVVTPTGGDAGSASYAVASAHFDVVVATSNSCWLQVTSSSVPEPLASGVQPGGKVLTFASQGTMTVQVGSSAVLVGVKVKGKNVFTDAPKTAPFTYVFASASPVTGPATGPATTPTSGG